jgi:hypothetical protein
MLLLRCVALAHPASGNPLLDIVGDLLEYSGHSFCLAVADGKCLCFNRWARLREAWAAAAAANHQCAAVLQTGGTLVLP